MELTHDGLLKALLETEQVLTANASSIAEAMGETERIAQDLGRTAESIARFGVAQATRAEAQDLARIISGAAEAAGVYAARAADTATQARAASAVARREHSGIQDAWRSSPEAATSREWFTQE
jgi:hypothetical protein